MKKFTAMITFLALFLVMCLPTVSATGTTTLPGADFVAGTVTKTANMIINPQLEYSYEHVCGANTDSFVSTAYDATTRTDWMSVTTDPNETESTLSTAPWMNPHGFRISQYSYSKADSDNKYALHDFDGVYVFSAQVKVGSESETESVEFGARLESTAFEVKKQTITGKDAWTDFKQNLTATKVNETYIHNVKFGITDAAVGTKSQIVVNLTSADAPYLAKEQNYDITTKVTSGSAIVPKRVNSTLTVKAELLNQIGLASSDQGTFNWYALNEERTAVATGVTVTGNTDNTATVFVSDTAEAGTYQIVAESNKDKQFVRTLTVEVVNVTEFAGVTKEENKFDSSKTETAGGKGFSYDISSDVLTLTRTSGELDGNHNPNGHGFAIKELKTEGTKYVVSTKLKNNDTSKQASVDFGMKIGYYKHDNADFETMNVTGTDWTPYTMILKNLGFQSGTSDWGGTVGLIVGFLSTEDTESASVSMDLANTYVAEEQLYNITHTTTDSTTFTEGVGGSLTTTAKLWNQIDLEYSEQGGFSWLALNEEKTAVANGITVTPDESTNTATVSVGTDVPAGKYNIVAISDKDASFVRTLEINVVGESVSELSLNTTETGASLAAKVENTSKEKVWFFLAAYDGTEGTETLTDCKMVEVTVINGTACVTEDNCALTGLTAGQTVKAFVWGNDLKPIEIGSSFTTTGTIPGSAS